MRIKKEDGPSMTRGSKEAKRKKKKILAWGGVGKENQKWRGGLQWSGTSLDRCGPWCPRGGRKRGIGEHRGDKVCRFLCRGDRGTTKAAPNGRREERLDQRELRGAGNSKGQATRPKGWRDRNAALAQLKRGKRVKRKKKGGSTGVTK